jgi:hypothetical protein
MNVSIDFKNESTFTCGDLPSISIKNQDLIQELDTYYYNTSNSIMQFAKDINNSRFESQNSAIFNRNIATECTDYKNVDTEFDMVYATQLSSKYICPPKTSTKYDSCINFIYKSDHKLLSNCDYLNCKNIPENLICAAPICKNDKIDDKLWNNNTKRKTY